MHRFFFILGLVLLYIACDAQNVGIGISNPVARLHVSDSNVVFTGPSIVPGSTTFNPPTQGAGTRMMWYPQKAAFRTGVVQSNQWDKDSIGRFSFAAGYNVKAKEDMSIAMGNGTTASGLSSTAIGYQSIASGLYSTSIGYQTLASNEGSIAMGYLTSSSGIASIALGNGSTATGNYSTAMTAFSTASGAASIATGFGATASGDYSVALGPSTVASGNSSTAMGTGTTASGSFTTAMGMFSSASGAGATVMGMYNKAKSNNSLVIGSYNDTTATNRLFEIGNGTADNIRSNAMTVLQNGNVGINSVLPVARLHVADSNVVFTGPVTIPSTTSFNPPVQGPGTRMMWYPEKAAFRVGFVDGTDWDKDNIGNLSFAAGMNSRASGEGSFASGTRAVASGMGSTAMGYVVNASADNSTAIGAGSMASGEASTALGINNMATATFSMALGHFTTSSGVASFTTGTGTSASGEASTAMGFQTTAIGNESTALGYVTKARGYTSVAMGHLNIARSDYSLVVGKYNDTTAANRLFEIGDGAANNARSNAMTVLQNGNVGIGTVSPSNLTEIIGPASAAPVTLVIGNRGGFGPAAMEFVSDYGLSSKWRPGFIRSNDAGGFTGKLEFYTNGTGSGNLYGEVKGFEIRNGIAYTSSGTVSSFSDLRLKKNIQPFTHGLDVITKINPVSFDYNDKSPFITERNQIGIIAQELEQVAPYMVDKTNTNQFEDLRSVNNQAYTFLLINAVKEQQAQIEKQQKQIDELQKIVEQLLKNKK